MPSSSVSWRSAGFRHFLCSALFAIAAVGLHAASAAEPPSEGGGVQAKVTQFCDSHAISERAVQVALVQVWLNSQGGEPRRDGTAAGAQAGDGRDTDGRQLSPSSLHRSASEAVSLYWHAWKLRMEGATFRIVPAPDSAVKYRLERDVVHTPPMTYDCFSPPSLAGDEAARALVEIALAEARVVESDPANSKLGPREYMGMLTNYQAIILIRYLLKLEQEGSLRKEADG